MAQESGSNCSGSAEKIDTYRISKHPFTAQKERIFTPEHGVVRPYGSYTEQSSAPAP
jgi:hypothetical protein